MRNYPVRSFNPWVKKQLLKAEREKRNQEMFITEKNGIKIYQSRFAHNYGWKEGELR